jgi:hypothetical protein
VVQISHFHGKFHRAAEGHRRLVDLARRRFLALKGNQVHCFAIEIDAGNPLAALIVHTSVLTRTALLSFHLALCGKVDGPSQICGPLVVRPRSLLFAVISAQRYLNNSKSKPKAQPGVYVK